MNKLLLSLVALLTFVGGVQASPYAYDPTNGPSALVVPVYNNSGGALDEGDVVIWDIDASSGDDDFYVTTTTTAETGLVAGVIAGGGCATASTCNMVIWGIAQCDVNTVGATEAGTLCTSTTAGAGKSCTDSSVKYAVTGTTTAVAGQVDCVVNF